MAKRSTRNTKSLIVDAAWKLFYEQGYEDTTVEEIIERSATSKGSFYHYFDGRRIYLCRLFNINRLDDYKFQVILLSLFILDTLRYRNTSDGFAYSSIGISPP